jgi:2-keto-3-deoxy-L-rhamnonate aldolase RhmA
MSPATLPRRAFSFLPLFALLIMGCGPEAASQTGEEEAPAQSAPAQSTLIRLWTEGQAAFGIFVPNERPRDARAEDGSRLSPLYTVEGGVALAQNELLDFLFLNQEGSGRYDPEAVASVSEGIRTADVSVRPTLLVRIPPISEDGPDSARVRIAAVLARGANGVVIPHVRSPEEAQQAVSFFADAGADVWSPTNPDGDVIAFIMIEDEGALAAVQGIADTPGYSVLACGIGSLTRALGGDREAGEAGNQEVLAHAKRVGVPDVITANANDVASRIEEGFLGLLMSGPRADDAIRVGREAAGR